MVRGGGTWIKKRFEDRGRHRPFSTGRRRPGEQLLPVRTQGGPRLRTARRKRPPQRHHVRYWLSERLDDDGPPIWVGSAIFDQRVGFSRDTGQITHVTAADIDDEGAIIYFKIWSRASWNVCKSSMTFIRFSKAETAAETRGIRTADFFGCHQSRIVIRPSGEAR